MGEVAESCRAVDQRDTNRGERDQETEDDAIGGEVGDQVEVVDLMATARSRARRPAAARVRARTARLQKEVRGVALIARGDGDDQGVDRGAQGGVGKGCCVESERVLARGGHVSSDLAVRSGGERLREGLRARHLDDDTRHIALIRGDADPDLCVLGSCCRGRGRGRRRISETRGRGRQRRESQRPSGDENGEEAENTPQGTGRWVRRLHHRYLRGGRAVAAARDCAAAMDDPSVVLTVLVVCVSRVSLPQHGSVTRNAATAPSWSVME